MDTTTNKDNPSAASQAAKTKRIMGIILARVVWVIRIVIVTRINRESIIPSRHSSEDIRWDRYMSKPRSDTVNANKIFRWVKDILIIMKLIIV